ncbi:mediator of RNA polymerase II transcription subunit 9 [Engystomops pustulosus]|uniref:mediator of RNA polymerase II transcription subunit 9 n=1 Tax=Engystomops pustulosus TaxID=76066 RepID=UPI003AFA91F7
MATGSQPRASEEPEEEEEEEEEAVTEEEEEDCTFLPLVHDIIKCMDKDSQDVYQELNELKSKFQSMRKQINNMAGIELSPEQQQQHLQSLRVQVQTKNELLQKYKSLCMFEIPKD